VDNVEHFFQQYGEVDVLEPDDDFRAHLRERGRNISVTEIVEVHASLETEYSDNEAYQQDDRNAPVIMLGYTHKARFLSVPIDPTGNRGVWRPRTAYKGDKDDEQQYWEYKGLGS
jgi:hypothetical protein